MVSTDHLGVSKVITNMLTSKACLYMVSYISMATVSFKIEDIVENRTQGSCLELPVLYHRAMTTGALETNMTASFSLSSDLPNMSLFTAEADVQIKVYEIILYW